MAYFRCGNENKNSEPESISLLHFEDDFVNRQITDAKGVVYTVDSSREPTITSNTFKFGAHSLEFNEHAWVDSEILPNQLNFQDGDFSIDLWVKVRTTARICPISLPWAGVLLDISNFRARMWMLNENGQLVVHADNSSGGGQGKIVIANNTWTHLALIREGDILGLFVNGILDVYKNVGNTKLQYDAEKAHIRLGCWDMDDYYTYSGYLDEVRITNKAIWQIIKREVPTEPYKK